MFLLLPVPLIWGLSLAEPGPLLAYMNNMKKVSFVMIVYGRESAKPGDVPGGLNQIPTKNLCDV